MSNFKLKRTVTESQKKFIAGCQRYKCANNPNSNLNGLSQYDCPLWKNNDGSFDEAGYEIDHIEEFCKNGNDDNSNLQALCISCHRVKTKLFNMNRKQYNKNMDNNECSDDPIDNELINDDSIDDEIVNDDSIDNEIVNDGSIGDEFVNDNESDDESESNDNDDNESTNNNIKIVVSGKMCHNCGKIFTRRANLIYHINHNTCKQTNFSCDLCGKNLSSKTSLYRHKKTACPEKKKQDTELNNVIQKLIQNQEQMKKDNEEKMKRMEKKFKKDNNKLKKEVKKLTNKNNKVRIVKNKNNNNNNTINKGTVINNNNNITLVGYGEEDLKKLTEE